MKALLTAATLALAATPTLAMNQKLFDSVRAELDAWGMHTVSIAGLPNHKLLTIKHILHSDNNQATKRGMVLSIVDPDRHSLRRLFN